MNAVDEGRVGVLGDRAADVRGDSDGVPNLVEQVVGQAG